MREIREVKLLNYSEKNGITHSYTPVNDQIAEYGLFGWKIEKKEEIREMNGLKDFTNYVNVTFVRELENAKESNLKKLEEEYFKSKDNINLLKEELTNLATKRRKLIEPSWKDVKTTSLGDINYTETSYYGGYTPVHWMMVVLLFTPLLPISLIYLIVKVSKNSKCKKQFKIALADYNAKVSENSKQQKIINEQIKSLEDKMSQIIIDVNNLK